MIGINKIDPVKKIIFCDAFNLKYGTDVKELVILFDSILSASICENTYHLTPTELIEKIEVEKE